MTADDTLEALSPLADPVVGAIFCDVEHAGKAAASIVGAVLAKDGISLGRIISVTPQRYYKHPGERGVRIDIEAATDANEDAVIEVQLYSDPSLLQRNLLAAARIFVDKVPEGTPPEALSKAIPRVIAIDILNYILRNDNPAYFQPIKLLYTQTPQRVAVPQFSIYALQLPRVREARPDFNDNLYCWLYLLDTANRERKTITEVLSMTPELKTFSRDRGFLQYCERYNRVASNPEIRDEYFRWVNEQMRQAGMIEGGRQEGYEAGIIEGDAKGYSRAMLKAAQGVLASGRHTPQEVAAMLGLPLADVQALAG